MGHGKHSEHVVAAYETWPLLEFSGAALCLMLQPFREETGFVLSQEDLSRLESGDAGEAVLD